MYKAVSSIDEEGTYLNRRSVPFFSRGSQPPPPSLIFGQPSCTEERDHMSTVTVTSSFLISFRVALAGRLCFFELYSQVSDSPSVRDPFAFSFSHRQKAGTWPPCEPVF